MTEISKHEAATPALQHDYEMMWKLSQRVSNTPFVPSALRGKNEAVLACILYGSELGLGPMQSLNSIHVIEGRTAMSPELMRAMVARHGHRIDVIENSATACEVKGTRADTGSTATVRWTMEDAKLAGLAGKNNWKTYPRAMLLARATSELCRIVFPDVIAGLSYTPEEVASIAGVDYTPEDATPELPPVVETEIIEPEIVEAEIIEEEPTAPESPKKFKTGEKVTMKKVEQVASDLKEQGFPATSTAPVFDERLRICENEWGKWPLVKAIANVQAKLQGCDSPTNAYQLAHNEKLWIAVEKVITRKGEESDDE